MPDSGPLERSQAPFVHPPSTRGARQSAARHSLPPGQLAMAPAPRAASAGFPDAVLFSSSGSRPRSQYSVVCRRTGRRGSSRSASRCRPADCRCPSPVGPGLPARCPTVVFRDGRGGRVRRTLAGADARPGRDQRYVSIGVVGGHPSRRQPAGTEVVPVVRVEHDHGCPQRRPTWSASPGGRRSRDRPADWTRLRKTGSIRARSRAGGGAGR